MGFFSSSIFPIMQALMVDSCSCRVGAALGLTTTSQSVATVISPIITVSLFVIGVGRAVALGAMIPAALTLPVALMLKDHQQVDQITWFTDFGDGAEDFSLNLPVRIIEVVWPMGFGPTTYTSPRRGKEERDCYHRCA